MGPLWPWVGIEGEPSTGMVVKETSRHQMAEHDFVSDLDGVGEQGETHKRTAGPRCAIRRSIFLEETFLHGTPHQVQE